MRTSKEKIVNWELSWNSNWKSGFFLYPDRKKLFMEFLNTYICYVYLDI